jgi:hypothetical protein
LFVYVLILTSVTTIFMKDLYEHPQPLTYPSNPAADSEFKSLKQTISKVILRHRSNPAWVVLEPLFRAPIDILVPSEAVGEKVRLRARRVH